MVKEKIAQLVAYWIAVDLSKQQDFDVYLKAKQQISFTRNQTQEGSADTTMFFIC